MHYCNTENIIIILFCLIFGAATLHAWKEYDSCYAPTRPFIISTLTLILLHRVVEILKVKNFVPMYMKRLLALFLNLIVHPTFIYVTIQGFIWHIMNISQIPNCSVIARKSWLIWIMLSILLAIDAAIIFVAVNNLLIWRRFRTYRRRQADIDEVQIVEEYINARLNMMFLIPPLDNNTTNTTCLSQEDIQKIPKRVYTEKETPYDSRQTFGDTCPVCFEDFKAEDEVCDLPSCKHVFHWKCIHGWFTMSPQCPVCRTNVKESLYTNEPPLLVEEGEHRNREETVSHQVVEIECQVMQ